MKVTQRSYASKEEVEKCVNVREGVQLSMGRLAQEALVLMASGPMDIKQGPVRYEKGPFELLRLGEVGPVGLGSMASPSNAASGTLTLLLSAEINTDLQTSQVA
jgi:hypothetical protein